MKLVLEDNQWWDANKVRRLSSWSGICDYCGTPSEYDGEFDAIILLETDDITYLAPLVNFHCPECMNHMGVFKRWKHPIDISAELLGLVKHEST
jgi:hypothetical protein